MKPSVIVVAAVALAASIQGAGPEIAISKLGDRVQIVFTGRLQAAPTPSGPWQALTNASPLIEDASGNRRFYRSVETTVSSLFDSSAVIPLTVTGPLQHHFELAHAGMPDGIFPPVREKPYFEGSVQVADQTIPVSLRVRGNSSLLECPFPKLKFKVSRTDRVGTPFEDAREVKIGTHCAEGGRGPIGRLREEKAAYREAVAYETMRTLGFVTPRLRRALIEYRDTTPPEEPRLEVESLEEPLEDEMPRTGWTVTRSAILLEDIEVIAETKGGRALDDQEITDLTNAQFDPVTIAGLRMLHALLGNWDYALSLDGSELWNTDVILLADGTYLPVAGDFDLASFVTADVRIDVPHDYHTELGDLERNTLYRLEQVKSSVPTDVFTAAASTFTERRTGIEMLLTTANVDDEGRANAQRHARVFYEALARVNSRDGGGK